MISSFTLVVFFGILLIIEFVLLQEDIVSPGFLYTASFFLCSCCTWIMSNSWEIEYISNETFTIISIGSILFLVVDTVFRFSPRFVFGREKDVTKNCNEIQPLYVSKSILRLSILLTLILIAWTMLYILKYAASGNWNAMMAMYKDVYNLDASAFGISRKVLNQFSKISIALNYLFVYIYSYNKHIIEMPKKTKRLFIINFILFILFRFLLTGGRQAAINFIVGWFTISYICSSFRTTKTEKKRVKRKYILLVIALAAVLFPAFYYMGRFVGRKEGVVLEASVGYLSTGIYGLEWMVSRNYAASYFSEHSFGVLFDLLKFIGKIPSSAEFVTFFPMTWHGNTVTIFGRWFWDFGVSGCFILITIVSAIFSNIYYKVINLRTNSDKRNISIIIYGYMINVLFFAGYDDFFFNMPTTNAILTFLIIAICYKYICKKKLYFSPLK